MKAIIELSRNGSVFKAAAQQIAKSRRGRNPDYRLSFESARSMFTRPELLDTLRRTGTCSVYALAKAAERSDDGVVSVPFDAVEIRFPLAQVA